MFRLEGPYPLLATTILLPSPRMSNIEAIKSTVAIKRYMDGSIRTYIRRKPGRKRHLFEFLVTVDKAEQLEDFVKRYPGRMVRVVWRDVIFGHLVLNPVERAGQDGKSYIVNLEIEE
jgi:hypothetical protein